MKVQIQKWGNSLALRIPKSLAVDTNITEGTTVELTRGKNGILVKPAAEEISLESLLDRVTPENLHGEADFGKPVGKEVW